MKIRSIRFMPLAILLLAVALTGAACSRGNGGPQANSVKQQPGVINLEGDPWSGYAPFRDGDFLKNKGYKYAYREELNQATRAGNLTVGNTDFLVTTMDRFLKNKPDGRIVAVIDQSLGADAFVLNTRQHQYLNSVDQLPRLVEELKKQGRKPKIAYTGDSPSEWLWIKLCNTRSDELRRSDFEEVVVDVSSVALAKLKDNSADVAVLWEPDVATAKGLGYTVGLTSKDVPNSVLDILVASNRIIHNNETAVQDVVNALYDYREKAIRNPGWWVSLIATDGKLNEDEAKTVLQGAYFYDAKTADSFMNRKVYPLDETKAFEALQTIGGIISLSDPTVVPHPSMIDGRFVSRAANRR